jgi:methylmalonyl-CoA mutase N-terminal domain/subunit
MTWEKFLAGEIDIDHVRPRMTFSYSATADPQFKECWALSNLRPMWARENRSRGASGRWIVHRNLSRPPISASG